MSAMLSIKMFVCTVHSKKPTNKNKQSIRARIYPSLANWQNFSIFDIFANFFVSFRLWRLILNI